MKIELILYASLACHMPAERTGNSCMLEIDDGSTVRDVLATLTIPEDAPRIMFLNGRHTKDDQSLKDGDRLAVFPPIAGG
jgi:molybdopterin synthase sulfur carrier subunit